MKKLQWADAKTVDWLMAHWQPGYRKAIARELRRLQKGEAPLAYRMLHNFGSKVGELKRGALRVVYTTEIDATVGIACAFRKDSKDGDKMRPAHERQINSGLRDLRTNNGISDERLFRVLH